MRSSTILLSALAAPLAVHAQDSTLSSSKRGLVYVQTNDASSDDSIWDSSTSDLTWYYNYKAEPTSTYTNHLQFVPMLWGAPSDNTSMDFYNTVKGLVDGGMNISYILTFNEPDGCTSGGSCVDAQTAAETWIREIEPLKKLGIKLGAPAVTGAPNGFNWLQNFFTQCAGQCSADFIPVHWYGNFEGLASHMGQVNGTYPNMTMWVTEFADSDVSLADSQAFYNQSTEYMDRLDYVTHYSYFGAFRSDVSNVGPNAAMLTQKGQLTDIGAWYLGQKATGNIPKGDAAQMTRFAGSIILVVAAGFYLIL
ncbi:glycoside hydrolase family 128 protein [Acrodontium crateriforme]|uniref:Glycoside hydrolase family 128 protein n=1 Tax=Acrodontium crateriforme TaxID=150365 RepID=A0AAQ3M2Y3_9PEZI|nr:glycoside hydrolase family 128 protein [Acrodontium crateriforme]